MEAMMPPQRANTTTPHSTGSTWRRRSVLTTWALAVTIGCAWIFNRLNDGIIDRRKEMLANTCDERGRLLQDQFAATVNHIKALSVLVSTFHYGKHAPAIDQKQFAEYTARTAFQRPLTSGVAYAQRVVHSEREQFERQRGWTIKMINSKEPSPVQEEYAPVIFAEATVSHLISLDMMSGKEDCQSILRSRAAGKGILTSPFRLKSNNLGIVITFPVYTIDLPADAIPIERIEATIAYLGGAFDVESLVQNLLHQFSNKQGIIVDVYDITNNSTPLILYGIPITNDGMSHTSTLDFGDPFRKHKMHCRFEQNPPFPWLAITTSIGIFCIALMVAMLVPNIFHGRSGQA